MTLKLGRLTLSTPMDVQPVGRNTVDAGHAATGQGNPCVVAWDADAYMLTGRETGATAQATLLAALLERRRFGSVYVLEDSVNPVIPEGYYSIESLEATRPRGAPSRIPWNLSLASTPLPQVCRQAHSDNVAGADTLDVTADEGTRVDYVTTGAYAAVLHPYGVAGAEAVNLPAGSWKIMLRAYGVTTATAQVRGKLLSAAAAVLATGSDITITPAGAWTDFDLGTLVVPQANDRANWYSVEVRDVTNPGSTVRLDRLYLLPV